jgi:mRNA interferase RelE/StbE
MAGCESRFKRSIAKDLRGISKKDVRRIPKRIEILAEDQRPRECEKLADQERYRIRQGQYRILYEIRDDVLPVVVVIIAKRSKPYG